MGAKRFVAQESGFLGISPLPQQESLTFHQGLWELGKVQRTSLPKDFSGSGTRPDGSLDSGVKSLSIRHPHPFWWIAKCSRLEGWSRGNQNGIKLNKLGHCLFWVARHPQLLRCVLSCHRKKILTQYMYQELFLVVWAKRQKPHCQRLQFSKENFLPAIFAPFRL